MALTVMVTKESVTERMERCWMIAFRLVVTDDAAEVINEVVSQIYKPGYSIVEVGNKIKDQMQSIIDRHKAEQAILKNPTMDTAAAAIQAALEV